MDALDASFWREQAKLVLRYMGEGMFGVDLEDKVTFINAAAVRMLGWRFEDLVGKRIHDLIQPDREPTPQKSGQKARVNEHFGVEVIDEQFTRRDGSCFPVAYTCSPIVDKNENITGAIYIFRDDTERKRYESELASARERADAANEAKTLFLAAMSHELRTPLNGVVGGIALLEHTQLDAKQAKHIHQIRLSSQLLIGLINDILDYIKIESHQLTLETTPTNLRLLVDEVRDALSMVALQKGLDFRVLVDNDVPKELLVDAMRLRQILTNLIANALKFTEQGYVHVTISVLLQNNQQMTIRFEIKDSGIGIPEDKQSRLFQKFTKADNSMTRRYGGTGLGLAICKQLVELMEGRISFNSIEGVGSTFWVELPLMTTQKEDSHEAQSHQVSG